MLNKIKEKYLLVCSVIVLFMILVVLVSGKKDVSYKKPTINKEEIISLLDNIQDNYTLSIEENLNNTITNYIYYNDSKIELYEKENNNIGYLKYNDKLYSVSNEDYKITEVSKIDFVSDEYYNVGFLKKVIDRCNFVYKDSNTVSCKIRKSEYYDIYNNIYNTNYGNEGSEQLDITIFYSTKINSIKIDYTSNNDIKIYNLKFTNIGNTDFSSIFEYYKDKLK